MVNDSKRHGINTLTEKVLKMMDRPGRTRRALDDDEDSEIAHVTPGEIVIPRELQTPELMAEVVRAAQAAGLDPRRFQVGNRRNAVNPRTGRAEFADPEIDEIPVTTHPLTGVMPLDAETLAKMMVSESTRETTPGLYQALGSVGKNRVGNPDVPNSSTLQDVLRQKSQFQGYGSPNWNQAAEQPGYPKALETANGILSGKLPDNTGGAVTFYSKQSEADAPPGEFAWRENAPKGTWQRLEPTARFAPFTFLTQPWGRKR